MKKDIQQREDIVLLLDTFYRKVLADDTIGYIFTDIAKIDISHHMPILYDFWSSVLLGEASYRGNPILTHISLHKKVPLEDLHFERWQSLYEETVHELFEGVVAQQAIDKVKQMRFLMQMKIKDASHQGFIQ